MENWAIVVGVDHYPASDSWTLHGAVRDAMAMREWLLRPGGGNVVLEKLSLLLSLRPGAPLPGAEFTPATHDNIVKTINGLLHRSGKRGGRFYFYFSGHGLSVNKDLSAKQGMLASDFDREASHHSLTVTSLFELFQGTHFREQYFVIDACRNIPLDRIRLGDFPYALEPVIPASPQFVMYATQPGVKAMEVGFPGDESGAFTSALLKGLNGEGAAKAWDDDTREYVVRWNELFSSVLEEVRGRKLRVDPDGGGPLIQEPRQYGERGDENPELGRFPDDAVPDVKLSIDLEPNPKVLPVASVSIHALSGLAREVRPPIGSLPIVADLRPRIYGVNGVATGYKPAHTKSVKLYKPATVKLEFQEDAPGVPPTGPPPPGLQLPSGPTPPILGGPLAGVRPPGLPPPGLHPPSGITPSILGAPLPSVRLPGLSTPIGLDSPAAVATFNKRLKGGLGVSVRESLALLQVANEAGTIVATGRGRIVQNDLPLGFYSVRMISPEGAVISEEIESPKLGGTREVELTATGPKSPAMDYLIHYAGFPRGSDGSISPSETVGPTFFLKTSTVLALAAAAQLEADSDHGNRLRKVPLPSFHKLTGKDTASGLHLVFGDERNEGFWESATASDIANVGDRQMHDGGGDSRLLKSLAIAGEVGRRNVRIEWADQAAEIPCHVLPGRVTLFVITREMDGSIEIHQYMPLSGVPFATAPGYPAHNAKDPQYHGSAFAAIRRIEYMQRTAAQGRVSPLKPDIELLLYDKWVDPIAGCLGSYLAFRTGMTEGLDVATTNLVRYFGELPDSHVLRGMTLLQKGLPIQAKDAFLQAIEIGLPVFREGVTLLKDRVQSLHLDQSISDSLVAASLQIVDGQLWSMKITESRIHPLISPTVKFYPNDSQNSLWWNE